MAMLPAAAVAQAIDPGQLPGIVLDDVDAERTGAWVGSKTVPPFVGAGYIHTREPQASVKFVCQVEQPQRYWVLLSYTPGANRSSKTRVLVEANGKQAEFVVDQRPRPETFWSFHELTAMEIKKAGPVEITISGQGADGYVIADAVCLLTAEQFEEAKKLASKKPLKLADKPNSSKKKPEQPPQPKFEQLPPSREVSKLTPEQLDELFAKHVGPVAPDEVIGDAAFLSRATLDVIGRQPTAEELEAFLADPASDKRAALVERLLADPAFGRNWANYWSDVISHRTPKPQLTFLDYQPLKEWLADQWNEGRTWDEVVFRLLTARGKVADNPAATFIGFHQGNTERIAGETTRVFLSVQIACAECHDHPFIDMPQETFHGLAAFFARADAKVAQLDSDQITVVSKDAGEHKMPGGKDAMQPVSLGGEPHALGMSDLDRRVTLARWICSADNPYFAKAFVNRIWARLMGRGFCEPVDEIGEASYPHRLPEVHQALADHFIASRHDPRSLFRAVMNTAAYQRRLRELPEDGDKVFEAAVAKKLRGDEIFDSLHAAIGLPNIKPPRSKKTGTNRFPPPAKSTRDLVNEVFGYDPSMKDDVISRTMKQAMFMMNNAQLQKQIDASPGSETFLARLLAQEQDDTAVIRRLYAHVHARRPTEQEESIVLEHLRSTGNREKALEDVLWSLINSAEFTTRQ